MKINKFLSLIIVLLGINAIVSCQENTHKKNQSDQNIEEIGIFNFDNKEELAMYKSLNLDESHPNLLNPQISESDHNAVIKSWSNFHQSIGNYLSKNNFHWEVDDEAILIVQKIYFEPNGQVSNYFFNILNESITSEKKEEFGRLFAEFAQTNRIDFQLDKCFAQCGKTKYLNN